MPNIVEFILQLQDEASNPLKDFAANTKGARYTSDQLTEANKRLKDATGKSSGSISDLKSKIQKLNEMRELLPANATKHMKTVNAEIAALQKNLDKLEGRKVSGGGLFKGLTDSLPSLLTNPLTLIGAGAAAAVNQGMKSSSQKLDLQLMLGDDAGSSLFENLKRMKGLLGEGIFDFAKDLKASGVAVDQLVPRITQLGEVARGDQQKLAALTSQFGELQKEGKLTDGILANLKANGFDPLVSISQMTGEKIGSVVRRFEEGKVSAKEIGKALEAATGPGGQFYGNLEKIANSPQGGWNALIDKVTTFTTKIGEDLLPVVTPVIDFLIDGFDTVVDSISAVVGWLQPLFKWAKQNADILMVFGGAILGAVAAIKAINMAKAAWTAITEGLTVVQGALNAVLLANPISIVIVAIAALVAGIMIAWNKFEGFRKFMYGLWETIKSVFTSIANLFKKVFEPIGEAIAAFKEGRWMDVAKAAGKMMFNLSPVGIVKNVVEFGKDGGFDDIGNAYARGAAKGAKSWAEDQKSKEDANSASLKAVNGVGESDAQRAAREKKQRQEEARLRADKNAKEGINAISGGGVKNITVTIAKMFDHPTYILQNGTKQLAAEIDRLVEESVVRAITSASARS